MYIENFTDSAKSVEIEEISQKTMEEIIKYMHQNSIERYYILSNKTPVFVINSNIIIDVFLFNKLNDTLDDFIKEKNNVFIVDAHRHIIDTYNYMRSKNIEYAAVVKNDEFIGEINFNTLSLKISFIAIKDPLTDTYNQKYFNVLIEEYNEISQNVGIIMVKIINLSIYEGLYGEDFVNKILYSTAKLIKRMTRSVDFIFRNEDTFKILTFNNAEITLKIKERLQTYLKSCEINQITIACKTVATQVPEIKNNILLAVEDLERELIKGD